MTSNRAKRSPVKPTFDVVQFKVLKKTFKKKFKKFKKAKPFIKKKIKKIKVAAPFIALKAMKKTPFILKKKLKFVPPKALAGGLAGGFAGAALGVPIASIVPGLAGAGGAIGVPALLSALGGGGGLALPSFVTNAANLVGPALAPLVGAG